LTSVVRESNSASRRNWAILLGLCVVLGAGALLLRK
jgi:LPXTG-motif cell wall-anchored protein